MAIKGENALSGRVVLVGENVVVARDPVREDQLPAPTIIGDKEGGVVNVAEETEVRRGCIAEGDGGPARRLSGMNVLWKKGIVSL